MYKPVKDGIEVEAQLVQYEEVLPPAFLSGFVHCFWELKTLAPLSEDFIYHVLPDACVNILFDQLDIKIAAITALQTTHKKLNLRRAFHFVGVQLLPGVWRGDPDEIKGELVDSAYSGTLSLVKVNRELENLTFLNKQVVLIRFLTKCVEQELVATDTITKRILENLNDIQTVADMARITNISSRQLQRRLKSSVGLTPHDFLKILRIQRSFENNYLDYYADQSHFIHSFRKITGYTPEKYSKKFTIK
jgi:AraC-like DNA-binding protein